MKFKISEYYKEVLTLTGGSSISNAIPLLISPILTRIFTPEEFGIFAVYSSIVMILASFSTGKYEMAILLPKTTFQANSIYIVSVTILFIFSMFQLFVIFIFKEPLLDFLKFSPEYSTLFLYSIPVAVFLICLIQIANYKLIRKKYFKHIAISNVIKTGSLNGSQLAFGSLNFSQTGLVSGFLFGNLIGAIVYTFKALSKDAIFNNQYRLLLFKRILAIYSDFPKFTAVHSLTNTTSSNLPQLLLNNFFSKSVAGFYGFAARICFAPIHLISSSFRQVFTQKISAAFKENQNIYQPTLNTLKHTAIIGILPFLILAFFSEHLFSFIFSPDWAEAGVYAQILSPYLFLVFIVTPLTYIPILLGEQKKAFFIELIYLILRVSALVIGGYYQSVILAISLFSITGFVTQFYILLWIIRIAKRK